MPNNINYYFNLVGIDDEEKSNILALLKEPHRKYHNQDHIEHLFDLAEEDYRVVPSQMVKSILLHDVVYYPQSKFNEELSAAYYQYLFPYDPHKDGVTLAILLTKDHCNPANDVYADWIKNFLDYDLEGLASNFRVNGQKIYNEFKPFVSREQFVAGRTAFYEKMLSTKHMFWNHPEWEDKARENITRDHQLITSISAANYIDDLTFDGIE